MMPDILSQDEMMGLVHRYQRGGLLLREIACRTGIDIISIRRAVLYWLDHE